MKNKLLVILVIFTLLLSSCSGKSTPASNSTDNSGSTSENGTTDSGDSANADLGSALNLVMGSDSTPSVFPSYHLDVTLDTPAASDDQTTIVNQTTQISADVAGKDVHILQTDPGETTQKEGFIVGDKEYKMVDGAAQEMNGQIALSWAMWPLQVVGYYAYPVYFAKKTGSDTIDGRAADVYSFDNTSAVSDTAMDAMGVGDMTTGAGTVWIDKETGAMLKLDMTYTSSITDTDQKEIGKGNGSIKLEISKVGQVTVTSPVQ